jgi:hypothetical protein
VQRELLLAWSCAALAGLARFELAWPVPRSFFFFLYFFSFLFHILVFGK